MGSVATVPGGLLKLPGLGGSNAAPSLVPGANSGTLPTVAPAATGIMTPTTGISAGISTADGSHTVTGDFKDTYGAGVGTALAGVLGGLGSSTDAAVKATNDQILAAAGRQQANMQATNAAHGISTDSSASALGMGDFNAQVAQTLATTDSQMELSEENELIQALMTEGQAHGGDVSGWDTFASVMKGVGSAVGDVAGAFIGDPKLGDQVSGSIWGSGKSTPQVASVPGSVGGTLFNGSDANELDALAAL